MNEKKKIVKVNDPEKGSIIRTTVTHRERTEKNKKSAFKWFWLGIQIGEDIRDKILNLEEARKFFEIEWKKSK